MKLLPKHPEQEVFDYLYKLRIIPETGIIYGVRNVAIGFPNGQDRYIYIGVNLCKGGLRHVRRTHIIWWAHYNVWPEQIIDHRDKNNQNDSISNLRYSNCTGNAYNAKDRNKQNGLPRGVYRNRGSSNVRAQISYRGKIIHLGSYSSIEKASEVYEQKRQEFETQTHNLTIK